MTWCPSVTPRSGRWGSAMPGCRPGWLAGLGGAAGGRADSVDSAGHCGAVEGRAPGLLCFKVVFLKDSQKGRCFKHVDGLHVLSRKPAPFPALCLATQRGAAPGASPGPSRPLRRVLVWAAGTGPCAGDAPDRRLLAQIPLGRRCGAAPQMRPAQGRPLSAVVTALRPGAAGSLGPRGGACGHVPRGAWHGRLVARTVGRPAAGRGRP